MALTVLERYQSAFDATGDGTTICKAAEEYGLPGESLRSRLHGLVPIECRRGLQLVYINEVASISLREAIEYRACHGLCFSTSELRFLVREAVFATSQRPVPDSFSNEKWIQRWVKKHYNVISDRKVEILDVKCAKSPTKDAVRHYYKSLQVAIKEIGLTDKPSQMWNCDETGVCLQRRFNERVICPKKHPTNVQ